ncbi:MAG TPA: hypothetical protein VK619_06795 [Pyrinomonadaceae bacterium]|nr:hypothetical protein [Pyrinomonadaceae bacterium]
MRLIKISLCFAALCALCLSLLAQNNPQDTVILRDGSEMTGRVNFLDENTVQVNGKPIERSRVKLIRLAGATNDAADEQAETDIVIMRDNRRSTGHVSFITDQSVIQSGNQMSRDQVALIRFADPAHVVTNSPQPTPSPSTSPSPSASPSPAASPSPGGSQTSGGSTKTGNESQQQNTTAETMPWFNVEGCDFIQKPYVFTDASADNSTAGRSALRCRMWINVCGTIIERVKTVDAQSSGACWRREDLDAPAVCCTVWGRYKQTPTSRYNPQVDADGDGIPNDQDDNPLGQNRSGGGNSTSNSNRR